MPDSRSATPTTMPKSASCSAMYDVFRAVVSAVSVTQTLRAPFATGCFVFGSMTASWIARRASAASSDFGVDGSA